MFSKTPNHSSLMSSYFGSQFEIQRWKYSTQSVNWAELRKRVEVANNSDFTNVFVFSYFRLSSYFSPTALLGIVFSYYSRPTQLAFLHWLPEENSVCASGFSNDAQFKRIAVKPRAVAAKMLASLTQASKGARIIYDQFQHMRSLFNTRSHDHQVKQLNSLLQ